MSDQAFWPAMPARARVRVLATTNRRGEILLGGEEEGKLVPASWWEAKLLIESENLEILAPDLPAWRWWPEASSDPDSFVVHGKHGEPRAIVIEGRHRKRFWITCSRVWANRKPDKSLCRDLERMGQDSGIGQWSTPSRLGDALQRRSWLRSQGWRWESRPNVWTRGRLLSNGVGGRGQTFKPGSRFTGVYEIDQRDAYAAAWALPRPSGPASMVPGVTEARGAFAAFGPVRFTIRNRLSCLGPLPLRGEETLSWPTEPGTYETWAWSEEVADALSCGIEVESIGTASAWFRSVVDSSWSKEMSELRRNAGSWGSIVKMATVAAIGRHGRSPRAYIEVSPTERDALSYGGRAYGQRDTDCSSITHWHSWAVMQARRRVWHRAVAEEWAGRKVLALETDSLVLDGPPLGPVVRRGDDHAGEWSVRRADCEVWTPLLRWAIFGDGSGRTPGLPGEMRAGWLAAHAPPALAT